MAKAESQTDDLISANERKFILDALAEQKRVDGRGIFDYRQVRITFGSTWGRVQIQLGQTRVMVVASCEPVRPFPDRPTEGFFKFNISFSPMASPAFGGRVSSQGVEIGRIVERGLRESGAIDTEALCIVAGEKVWSVRLDMHVLDDHGNISDCCSIGAITALHHLRRPDITISGDSVIVHSLKEKAPVPLSIHHMPVCITFSIINESILIVDPSWKEERCSTGRLSVTLNAQSELCGLQKSGGAALPLETIMESTKIAQSKVMEISSAIHKALENDKRLRKTSNIPASNLMTSGIGIEETFEKELQLMNSDENYGESQGSSSRRRFFQGVHSLEFPEDMDVGDIYLGSDQDDSSSVVFPVSGSSSGASNHDTSTSKSDKMEVENQGKKPIPAASKKGPIVKASKPSQSPLDVLKGFNSGKNKPVIAATMQKDSKNAKVSSPVSSVSPSKPSSDYSEKKKHQEYQSKSNKQSFEALASIFAIKSQKIQIHSIDEPIKIDSSDDEEEQTYTLDSEHSRA